MKITILSDASSWMNHYIPRLLEQLSERNCSTAWLHQVEQINEGDIVFYLGCGQIVPANILKRNQHNLVVHESDLPQGRGWSPLTWQILEGRNSVPIVLFEAAETVDSGPVYLKEVMNFQGTELVDELRRIQAECSIKLCVSFIDGFPDIVYKGRQQKGKATYYPRRTPEDSRLDPDKTLREQFNLFRVVDNQRYPAFFEIDGEEYVLRIEKRLST